MEISGKVALVTGGAWGIGRAIAKRLGDEGAAVVVADVDDEAGREVADSIAKGAFVRADVASEGDVQAMVMAAKTTFGGLDILVNNACEAPPPYFPRTATEDWSRILDVCLRGTMLGIQHGLAPMRERGGGAIVNVSSIAGLGSHAHAMVEYAVAKAAVVRLTETLAPLADELNVRVNCIAPDWTATEFVRERFDAMTEEERAEARDGFGRPAPERLLEPVEVADAVIGLVKDDSLAGRTLVCWCGEEPRLLQNDRWE